MVNTIRHIPSPPLLEPGAPAWAVRFAERCNQFFKLRHPQAPTEIWLTLAVDLPPAAQWTGCLVSVSDLACIAVSDGTNWRRINMGATIP